jgi:hypothetical protein
MHGRPYPLVARLSSPLRPRPWLPLSSILDAGKAEQRRHQPPRRCGLCILSPSRRCCCRAMGPRQSSAIASREKSGSIHGCLVFYLTDMATASSLPLADADAEPRRSGDG